MQPPSPSEVTRLLKDWSGGDSAALDRLMPTMYGELRAVAARYLRRERQDHTLQPTALVNEAYLRLIDQKHVNWQNRAHFVGVAAQMMRRILVDHAKSHNRAKRGRGVPKVPLDEAVVFSEERADDLVDLDEALTALAAFDERKPRIVEDEVLRRAERRRDRGGPPCFGDNSRYGRLTQRGKSGTKPTIVSITSGSSPTPSYLTIGIEKLPGSTPIREKMVKDALEYLDNLSAEGSGDDTLQRELASAYEKVGDVQGAPYRANLGNYTGALASHQQSPVNSYETEFNTHRERANKARTGT